MRILRLVEGLACGRFDSDTKHAQPTSGVQHPKINAQRVEATVQTSISRVYTMLIEITLSSERLAVPGQVTTEWTFLDNSRPTLIDSRRQYAIPQHTA